MAVTDDILETIRSMQEYQSSVFYFIQNRDSQGRIEMSPRKNKLQMACKHDKEIVSQHLEQPK